MKRLGFVGGVLVGVLILGVPAPETFRSHGQLSDVPRVTQPATPASSHPNDATSDLREVRERLPVRQATPTSANTVPAPVGDSSYAPIVSSWVGSFLIGSLLTGILFRLGALLPPLALRRT